MTNKNKLRPIVKLHGGKAYLSSWVIEHFPKNYAELKYLEPCCGAASVLFNKESANEEVISDIDKNLLSIFKSVRDEPQEFIDRLKKIKYCEASFEKALDKAEHKFDDYIDQGVNEYVLRRMSRGGLKKAFAWSDRMRGGQPGDVNAWATMIKHLPMLAERIKNVSILHYDFRKAVKMWNEEGTLIYIDPPYLPETRTATSAYDFEMSEEDHLDLLNLVKDARAKIIVSGYQSPLYNKFFKGWRMSKKDMANHSAQGKKKARRIECIWMNY
jgi:DNA adenine methylase